MWYMTDVSAVCGYCYSADGVAHLGSARAGSAIAPPAVARVEGFFGGTTMLWRCQRYSWPAYTFGRLRAGRASLAAAPAAGASDALRGLARIAWRVDDCRTRGTVRFTLFVTRL